MEPSTPQLPPLATNITVSPHAPLISALTTFYTLLVDLHHLPASTLVLPSSLAKQHSPNSINCASARRNGFSDAAVDLAYHIPYVTNEDIKINYETTALSYLMRPGDERLDEDIWDFARDPTFQDRHDLWTGNDVLVLTRGNLYGMELIYDLDKHTITEWQHFGGPLNWREIPAYPMTSPDNPLYVWIRYFLTLRYIPFEDDILLPREPWEYGYPGKNADEDLMRQWRKRVEDAEKERTLKNVYIQCGWKADILDVLEEVPVWEALEYSRRWNAEQFRGDEFEERKEEWQHSIWST